MYVFKYIVFNLYYDYTYILIEIKYKYIIC